MTPEPRQSLLLRAKRKRQWRPQNYARSLARVWTQSCIVHWSRVSLHLVVASHSPNTSLILSAAGRKGGGRKRGYDIGAVDDAGRSKSQCLSTQHGGVGSDARAGVEQDVKWVEGRCRGLGTGGLAGQIPESVPTSTICNRLISFIVPWANRLSWRRQARNAPARNRLYVMAARIKAPSGRRPGLVKGPLDLQLLPGACRRRACQGIHRWTSCAWGSAIGGMRDREPLWARSWIAASGKGCPVCSTARSIEGSRSFAGPQHASWTCIPFIRSEHAHRPSGRTVLLSRCRCANARRRLTMNTFPRWWWGRRSGASARESWTSSGPRSRRT